jgi:hypothetical protein
MELDGATTDNKEHKLSLSIEVETNIPIFNNKTIMNPEMTVSNVGTYTTFDYTLDKPNN